MRPDTRTRGAPTAQLGVFLVFTRLAWIALIVPVGVVVYLTLPDRIPDIVQGIESDPIDAWPGRVAGFMLPWGLLLAAATSGVLVRRVSRPGL